MLKILPIISHCFTFVNKMFHGNFLIENREFNKQVQIYMIFS